MGDQNALSATFIFTIIGAVVPEAGMAKTASLHIACVLVVAFETVLAEVIWVDEIDRVRGKLGRRERLWSLMVVG